MNTRIKSMAVVSAILAGVVAASAQQPEHRQKQRQNPSNGYGQQQCCPRCGAALSGLRQRNQNQYRQSPAGQQFQQRNTQHWPQNAPQFAPRQQRGVQQPFQGPMQPQLAPQQRQQILQRFDRDGDGRLSEQERNAVKQQIQQRNSGQTFQRPQGQQPTPDQRQQFQARRQQAIQLFDSDGDGQLSDQEKKALKKAIKERLEDNQPEKPRGQRQGERPPVAEDAE